MKKNRLLELIAKLNKYEISNEDVTLLLQQDEKIIEKIIDLEHKHFPNAILLIKKYQNVDDILTAIDLLLESKYYDYTLNMLINETAIQNGTSLDNARIMNESKNDYIAEYTYYILIKGNGIKNEIIQEKLKIINESKNDFNAWYASRILRNEFAISAGIAIEGARIINESKGSFNAQYVVDVLINEFAIKSGKALEMAKNIVATNSSQEARILSDNFIKEIYDNYLKELINNSSEGEEINPADLAGKVRTLKK